MSKLSAAPLRLLARVTLVLSALWLAACTPMQTSAPTTAVHGPVPVALLVPKSGSSSGDSYLADNLEKSARMAVNDLGADRITLKVYDSGGNPAGASAAATQALADGARVIVGPVYAQAANAAGLAAASKGVSVLAFSNNPAIAGNNVFVLGNLFSNRADRLARYAAAQGIRKVLIVHGNDAAENIGAQDIATALGAAGIASAGSIGFDLSQNGVDSTVPQIISQAKASGAQALFFTSDTTAALPALTRTLAAQGLGPDKIQYIGLTRWDQPPSAPGTPSLQGGWFAVPDPGVAQSFAARYQSAYGTQPHPLAGLAYDAIAAIGALSKEGRAPTASALTQSAGFVGAGGVFRLLPNGTNQRALAVAQIQNGSVSILDPAPHSFGGF